MGKFVLMPKQDVSMQECTIDSWKVTVGDTVTVGQVLLSVESGKTVDDVPSPFEGTVLKIMGEEGDEIAVGAPIAFIGEPGEAVPDTP